MFLVIALLWYCISFPNQFGDSFLGFLDHESMRMWIIAIILGLMWAFGTLAYRRLVVNPKPKELEKELGGDDEE